MCNPSVIKLYLDITAAAFFSDGRRMFFDYPYSADVAAVITWCRGFGSKINVLKNGISIKACRFTENSYVNIDECNSITLNYLAGLTAVSDGTAVFHNGNGSLSELGENVTDRIKGFGCLMCETADGFIITSGYNDEILRFPSRTDEAFVCGVLAGSALGGKDTNVFFNPNIFGPEFKSIFSEAFEKYSLRIHYTNEGAYISSCHK